MRERERGQWSIKVYQECQCLVIGKGKKDMKYIFLPDTEHSVRLLDSATGKYQNSPSWHVVALVLNLRLNCSADSKQGNALERDVEYPHDDRVTAK